MSEPTSRCAEMVRSAKGNFQLEPWLTFYALLDGLADAMEAPDAD